ncbi:MAG: sarcosine oxidase subunit gamma [Rhodobacterales bacterium]|nr:sarcosine oxidase subunit gamma [Rhodobacterales bacterium]
MVSLIARTPAEGLLPATIAGLTLAEVTPLAITAVLPFAGQDDAVSRDMGFTFPAPNRTTAQGDTLAIWAGRDMALVLGDPPATRHAAMVDQSDAWAVLDLTGQGGDKVLARLCPIDTRPAAFPPGHTARSLLGHVQASITRLSGDALRLIVPRSMAQTAVHDLTRAMGHAQRQM